MNSAETSEMLARSAGKGDRRAFEQLVTLHYDFIFRVAFKWCRNRADAEDIAQDACVRLAKSIASFSGKSAFTTWLYRLVINAAIDWQRRNKGNRALESERDMDEQAAIEANAETQFYARQILAQVGQLPVKEKMALLLVHAEGLSHAEAAAIMEVKESTISWYIHEARKKLSAGEGARAHG